MEPSCCTHTDGTCLVLESHGKRRCKACWFEQPVPDEDALLVEAKQRLARVVSRPYGALCPAPAGRPRTPLEIEIQKLTEEWRFFWVAEFQFHEKKLPNYHARIKSLFDPTTPVELPGTPAS
jgi:hypothetical protein